MTFNFGDIRGQITKLLSLCHIEYPSLAEHLTGLTLQAIPGKLANLAEEYIQTQVENGLEHMVSFYKLREEEFVPILIGLLGL